MAISVRAVQGISHRKKVFTQTLPNKLSLVTNKLNHIIVWKYVKIKLLELLKVKASKGPFLTSCDIERRQQQRIEFHNLISARKLFFKNLASVISYLSSDSLRYSNLYEHFKTKLQDSIQCNRR